MVQSVDGVAEVRATSALLAAHRMAPRVPACLLVPPDPERLLSSILASTRRPSGRPALGSPGHQRGAPVLPAVPGEHRATGTTVRSEPHRRRRATRLAAVAAATLVVALVAAEGSRAQQAMASTVPSLSYGSGDLAESTPEELPDAGATLRDLADAARQTPEPARTGTVQHVVAQEWLGETGPAPSGPGQTTAVYPTVTERWLAVDGSGLITQRRAAAVTYDGAIDSEAGPSPAGDLSSDVVLPGTFDDVARLPRDPAALTAEIVGRSPAECSLDGWAGYCLTEQVQAYFGSGVVPQDLAGAFWDTLSQQPTVRLLGPTTDRAGREGTAVAVEVPKIPEDPSTDESVLVVIVSEETGQMLSTETLTLRSDLLGITSPTVTGFSAVTRSEYTTEVGR